MALYQAMPEITLLAAQQHKSTQTGHNTVAVNEASATSPPPCIALTHSWQLR